LVEDHRTSISWRCPLTPRCLLFQKNNKLGDAVKVVIVFKKFPGVNRNASVAVGCNVMSWGTNLKDVPA
jgi:hypothetical protein